MYGCTPPPPPGLLSTKAEGRGWISGYWKRERKGQDIGVQKEWKQETFGNRKMAKGGGEAKKLKGEAPECEMR